MNRYISLVGMRTTPPEGLEEYRCYRIEYGGTGKECLYEGVIWLPPDCDPDYIEHAMENGCSLKEKIMSESTREMPRYKCHKIVWALQIANIKRHNENDPSAETDGSAIITPAENGYAPFRVDHTYMLQHKPVVGGYYVVYEDGYKSFSPASAFEAGYSLME